MPTLNETRAEPDVYAGMSIEQVAELLSVGSNERTRLTEGIEAAKRQAEAAYEQGNTEGIALAFAARDDLTARLEKEDKRRLLLSERLSSLTQPLVDDLNVRARLSTDPINAHRRELVGKLYAAIAGVDAVLTEFEAAPREIARAHEKALQEFDDIARRCAPYRPSGVVWPQQHLDPIRLDRAIAALGMMRERVEKIR